MHTILTLIAATSLAAADAEWIDLFNGKDLSGWTLFAKKGPGYVVENGLIVCPEGGGGNLLTTREFSNFTFRFDFRLSAGGNNGVGLRAPLAGDIAYSGMEIQILDHDHPRYQGRLQPWQRNGSLYNVFPATADALKPAGQWNAEEITADGTHIKVVLNGTTILDADISTVKDTQVLKKHPGLQRTSGRVGFLGHDTRVEFRNIRLKPR